MYWSGFVHTKETPHWAVDRPFHTQMFKGVLKILKTDLEQLKKNFTGLSTTVAELKKENAQLKTTCKCGATTTNASNVDAKKPAPNISSTKPTPKNASTVSPKKPDVPVIKPVVPVVPAAATTKTPAQVSKVVGFTAALTKIISLGEHQPVEYDKVLTNEGKAFDKRHGHFIAPVKGLYILSATIINIEKKEMHMEMVKNGVQLVAFYADPDDYSMGSQTVVVTLEANDMVWMRHCRKKKASSIYGKPDQPINTFSGALLIQLH
ncbi:Hypothetical predicted protein [Mytilus galloprovincialis]|uniref:C1q domain-containing protein n=1 Tax=Mytilus galloprovincialis TaxID=29158 RepID=A0A8B6HKJ4_MYTGA|nr:Hypothetical predicted protein [Mytilus galloprovincialis]